LSRTILSCSSSVTPLNQVKGNGQRTLKEALEDFAGCAVVVSHDRWFLDRLCTHLLAFEGDSRARLFVSHWSDDETDDHKSYGPAVEVSKRAQYRTLRRSTKVTVTFTSDCHFL
jgi:energy-dependent translational throttle protein EttA